MSNYQILREMYSKETDEQVREKIKTAGIAAKNNPEFGGKEDQNGYCYTCLIEEAREDFYNCDSCAGRYSQKKKKYSNLSTPELQQKILEAGKNWNKSKPQTVDEMTTNQIYNSIL